MKIMTTKIISTIIVTLLLTANLFGQLPDTETKEVSNDGSYDKQIEIAYKTLELIKEKKYKNIEKLFGKNGSKKIFKISGLKNHIDRGAIILNKYGLPKKDSVKILTTYTKFPSVGTASGIEITYVIGYDEPDKPREITIGFQKEFGETDIMFISTNEYLTQESIDEIKKLLEEYEKDSLDKK